MGILTLSLGQDEHNICVSTSLLEFVEEMFDTPETLNATRSKDATRRSWPSRNKKLLETRIIILILECN